jgi:acyl-CoA hydrolase
VNYVGNTSLIVGIRVEAMHPITGKVNHTNSCYFTMAAKDEFGNLVQVPGLIIESETQLRRFCEGMELKKLSKQKRMMLQSDLNAFSVDQLKAICIEESDKVKITC